MKFVRGDRVKVINAYLSDADPTGEIYPTPRDDGSHGVVTHFESDMFNDGSEAIHVTLDNGRRVWGHANNFQRTCDQDGRVDMSAPLKVDQWRNPPLQEG